MPKSVPGVMREFKAGTLHSGSKTGPKVTSRKQAVAIALSENAQAGKKHSTPKKKTPAHSGRIANAMKGKGY